MKVNQNTLRVLRDELENIISVCRDTVDAMSGRHWEDSSAKKETCPKEEEPRPRNDFNEGYCGYDSTNVVDKVLRQTCSVCHLRYAKRRYRYSKVECTSRPSQPISYHFIVFKCRWFDKRRGMSLLEIFKDAFRQSPFRHKWSSPCHNQIHDEEYIKNAVSNERQFWITSVSHRDL